MKPYLLLILLLAGCRTGSNLVAPSTNSVIVTNSVPNTNFPASSYRQPLDPNPGELRQ